MTFSLRFSVLWSALASCRPVRFIRFEHGAPLHAQRAREADQAMLVRELSKRLPPRLVKDVTREE